MEKYKENLLKLAAKYEITDMLSWNTELDFYLFCNDVFGYATADSENILNQADVDLLEKSLKDADIAPRGAVFYGIFLFIARKRKMMPLEPFMPSYPELAELFVAATKYEN